MAFISKPAMFAELLIMVAQNSLIKFIYSICAQEGNMVVLLPVQYI